MSKENRTDAVGDDAEAMAEDIAAAEQPESEGDELSVLRDQLREAEDRVLRVQADADNIRKRARRDAETSVKFATLPLLTDLLPIVDNFRRAVDAQQPAAPAAGLLEGVKMVSDQLTSVLAEHGCREILAEGQAFDPMFHEAVLQQPSDLPQGTVIQVTQTGYKLHDRVIRPAQVIVSRGSNE